MTQANGENAQSVPLAEVEDLYRGSTEMEQSEDAPSAQLRLNPEVPGSDLFNGLVNAAPFSEYLHYKARSNCTHNSDQDRIRHYSAEHHHLALWCMMLDLGFRIFVVAAILGVAAAAAAGVIYKTFFRCRPPRTTARNTLTRSAQYSG